MNILISPLNWGIGHATRLVPIIKILSKKHNVVLAADGNSYYFLKKEFPNLKIEKAPSLEIKYSPTRFLMPIKILFSLPKMIVFYFQNRKWIKNYIKKHKTDVIISDNRFGFFDKNIHSIFITHQINIAVPKQLLFVKPIVFLLNKINIQKFDECWIPDNQNQISGELSNSVKLKIKSHRIGILSRFDENFETKNTENYKLVCLISGPEPQRTKLEDYIKESLEKTEYKSLILSGKPVEKKDNTENNITIKSHLETDKFQEILKNADIIIARAGYSTIMDLITLKRTAILIPTPGQTEQEYLANYLHNRNMFINIEQQKLDIEKAISNLISQKEKLEQNIIKLNSQTNLKEFLDKKFKS
jgi:uncharacterized protein (TIGR00661 family)